MINYLRDFTKRVLKSIDDKRKSNKYIKESVMLIHRRQDEVQEMEQMLAEDEDLTPDDRECILVRMRMMKGYQAKTEANLAEHLKQKAIKRSGR